MDSLTFLFTTVSVIGLMFLLWLYTKPGKKWLKELWRSLRHYTSVVVRLLMNYVLKVLYK